MTTPAETFVATVRPIAAALMAALAAYDAAIAAPPAPPASVVLIGDSRIADYPDDWGTWSQLLERPDIVSKGVPGEKALDWLNDQPARLLALQATGASRFVIQYGKNDIDGGATAAVVAQRIVAIIQAIKSSIPGAKVAVLGVLPVTTSAPNAAYINAIIDQTGTSIYTAITAANVGGVWHQGYAGMKGGSNDLLPQYAADPSHLNAAGRAKWGPSILTAASLLQ